MKRTYSCPTCWRRLHWRPDYRVGLEEVPRGAYVCEPCASAWAPEDIEPQPKTQEAT